MGNDNINDLITIKDFATQGYLEKTKTDSASNQAVKYLELVMEYIGELPENCSLCGGKMIKHGKRTIKALDTPLFGHPVELKLQFQRARCTVCNHVWQPDMENIDEKHHMTKRAYQDISIKSIKRAFKTVSEDYLSSATTIKNVFTDFMVEKRDLMRFKTPVFLGIDEIKIRKIGEVTVITDLEHRTVYDMLNGRNQDALTEYFSKMPDAKKVLWVCSDMYRPFQKSIEFAMPNATWVIDHFHVVMKANEAVDFTRRQLQDKMSDKDRISTKRGLAYTLRTRAKDLSKEESYKIRTCRGNEYLEPLAVAFDLKEDFFNIYDENMQSRENAEAAFAEWEKKIPDDPIYEKFAKLAKTVHNFYDQIFNYFDCPLLISNGYTECSNRLIREDNIQGRGYTFEILRGRTMFRQVNVENLMSGNGKNLIGPGIPENGTVFFMEASKKDEDMENQESILEDTHDS